MSKQKISLESLKAQSSQGTPCWVTTLSNGHAFTEYEYNMLTERGVTHLTAGKNVIKYYKNGKEIK